MLNQEFSANEARSSDPVIAAINTNINFFQKNDYKRIVKNIINMYSTNLDQKLSNIAFCCVHWQDRKVLVFFGIQQKFLQKIFIKNNYVSRIFTIKRKFNSQYSAGFRHLCEAQFWPGGILTCYQHKDAISLQFMVFHFSELSKFSNCKLFWTPYDPYC